MRELIVTICLVFVMAGVGLAGGLEGVTIPGDVKFYPDDTIAIYVTRECADIDEVLDTLKSLLGKAEPNNWSTTTADCKGCTCVHPMGGVKYYECLAWEARKEAEFFKGVHDLIGKIEKEGCIR